MACDRYPTDAVPGADVVRVKDIVDLRREGADVPIRLGTQEVAQLVAYVPSNAVSPVVTFSASAGFFVLTGARGDVKVRAAVDTLDPARRLAARIAIRADTSSFALVSAMISDYRDTVRVAFVR